MTQNSNQSLIVDTSIRAFFQERVDSALTEQQLNANQGTVYYLVNLLTSFAQTKKSQQPNHAALLGTPLAALYAAAVTAPSTEQRHQALRQLGDIALFIAGIFTDSLNRKAVDVDYYIAMGGNAYGYLSDATRSTHRWREFSPVFDELATHFTDFVDVLGEVGEQAHWRNDQDVLRLYEVWLRSGSKRAERRLRKLGIQPLHGSVSQRHH